MQGDGEVAEYVTVHDVAGLAALVQWNNLEIHMWGARADDVERPDRITFDLDPGEGVTWAAMRTAATAVQALLDAVGLKAWLKTSGGKGLHIVVPIERRSSWDEVSAFARAVAEHLAAEAPEHFVSVAAKAKRPGKVFVDGCATPGVDVDRPWSMRAGRARRVGSGPLVAPRRRAGRRPVHHSVDREGAAPRRCVEDDGRGQAAADQEDVAAAGRLSPTPPSSRRPESPAPPR